MKCPHYCNHVSCGYISHHYIYALIDIRTGMPFYVGESVDPKTRRRQHVKGATEHVLSNYAKQVYIRSLLEDGLYPHLIVIDVIKTDCRREVQQLEDIYADFLRKSNIIVENGHLYDGYNKFTKEYKVNFAHLESYQIEIELEIFSILREMYLFD